ncbi:SIS domain-containing protein [Alphaproteobacteria bacterium endosymbiont of Tiliacea citrago]|uniref:SIS domain-containing protein n=1 Tax=Alphaproteobacteria bacterium endosymbiont of Tiliacea citrago TaxID=3077944 RepID=UPI00313C4624
MCGIVGVVNKSKKASEDLMFGLKQMEYRGYDSAGVVFSKNFNTYKSIGSLINLEKACLHNEDTIGIAHTRWATHGSVNLTNTHPIKIGNFAIVHNGIIEDTDKIIKEINYKPQTQTDTEILLAYFVFLRKEHSLEDSLQIIDQKIKGSYAALILEFSSDQIIWLKKGFSPIVISETEFGYTVASDMEGVKNPIKTYEINSNGYGIISNSFVSDFQTFKKNLIIKGEFSEKTTKENLFHEKTKSHNTWLEEEILEQIKIFENEKSLNLKKDFSVYHNVKLIGCGSSFFAAEIGAYWLEEENILASASIASEWNISDTPTFDHQLTIFISQSGFTADTVSALLKAKKYSKTLALVNKKNSPISNNSDQVVLLNAGTEKSVASTKSFSSQIIKLFQIIKGTLPKNIEEKVKNIFKIDVEKIVDNILKHREIFILGKNKMSLVAKEGMLKITEITYLNVFAYPAGELKHGYIAKITEETISIILAPEDPVLLQKTLSSAQEIISRDGKILLIASENYIKKDLFIKTDPMNYDEATFCYTILLQRIAFKLAEKLNRPIDKPRNLAKSVTVE